jgi:hypothetical protein
LQRAHAAAICSLLPPSLLLASPRWDYSSALGAARVSGAGDDGPNFLQRLTSPYIDCSLLHSPAHRSLSLHRRRQHELTNSVYFHSKKNSVSFPEKTYYLRSNKINLFFFKMNNVKFEQVFKIN